MQTPNSTIIHPILLNLLYDTSPEELMMLNSMIAGFSDNKVIRLANIYRSKRKDSQTILLLCLLGLVSVAGIHRFVLGQIGMGILYFFTCGLCFVGTIVDAINHKTLTSEYNIQMIGESFTMVQMMGD